MRLLAVAATLVRPALRLATRPAPAFSAMAQSAEVGADGKPTTIFQAILDGNIPSTKVYDDELIYAFRDIAPAAKTHIVIIPKQRDGLTGISAAEAKHAAVLGHLMVKAAEIAKAVGLADGYRLVVNEGAHGCQSVAHLHVHLIGGQQLTWPPGTGAPEGSMTG